MSNSFARRSVLLGLAALGGISLLAAGAIANYQAPEQMASRVRQDYAKWGKVIRDKAISVE